MKSPLISIAICTYERPALLEQTIRSVLDQSGIDSGDVELVIIDNSDSGSAQPLVAAFDRDAKLRIRYEQAHPANISVARNAAVCSAKGTWIAFLDDDLAVLPGWLDAIRDAVARYDYDVMFGPIKAQFADPATYSALADITFARICDAPAGFPLAALHRKSPQNFPLSTANCLLKKACLSGLLGPFDPRFGRSGGEDFHLFLRLEYAGHRFGWITGAACTESVPPHRCDVEYLARRYFAGGQSFAAAMVATSTRPSLTAAVIAVKARIQLLVHRLGRRRSKSDGETHVLREAGIRGKLDWRNLYPLYQTEASQIKSKASDLAGAGSAD